MRLSPGRIEIQSNHASDSFYKMNNAQFPNFVEPWQKHFALRTAPHCLSCGKKTFRDRCVPWNKNGNAFRPYYKCLQCGFSCFGDMRGVLAENPTCDCGDGMQFSRRTIAGPDSGKTKIPRSIFYQCAIGGCDFWQYMKNDQGAILIWSGSVNRSDLIREGF